MPGHKQVARNYQQNFQPSASTKCFAKQPESVQVWLLLGNLDPSSFHHLRDSTSKDESPNIHMEAK
jgi:hypothetical protein